MDCNLPCFSVHEFLQARILEWVAIHFSRYLPNPRIEPTSLTLQADSLPGEPPGESRILEWAAYPFSRGSFQTRNWTRSPALQVDPLTAELLEIHIIKETEKKKKWKILRCWLWGRKWNRDEKKARNTVLEARKGKETKYFLKLPEGAWSDQQHTFGPLKLISDFQAPEL